MSSGLSWVAFLFMKSEANNLVQLLDNSTADFPRRIALVFGARRISYRQLSSVSKKLSFNLYDLGVRELDKVALWLPNCPEFVYAFFAILRLRATVVPVNTMLKREEAKFILEDSRAKILICSIDKIDDSQNILSRLQSLRHLISLPAPRRPAAFPGAEAILDFKHLVRNGPELDRDIEIKADDLAEIVYTSGTTGRPKGACLSHKNLVSNVRDCVKAINIRR